MVMIEKVIKKIPIVWKLRCRFPSVVDGETVDEIYLFGEKKKALAFFKGLFYKEDDFKLGQAINKLDEKGYVLFENRRYYLTTKQVRW